MVQVIQTSRGNYLLSDPEYGNLKSERDILDLMGHFGEVGANILLISDGALHPDFFDLSTEACWRNFSETINLQC